MDDSDSKVLKPTVRRPPNAGKGRPKGSLNKTTQSAKEAIAFAAEALGGGQRILEWAQSDPDNEKSFWISIYPKLLPLQVNADIESNSFSRIEVCIVDPEV